MPAVAKRPENQKIARSLKVMVPLIREELDAGGSAGEAHYRRAGEYLVEVQDSNQVPYGSWGRWLSSNFSLSKTTANDYMRLARSTGQVTLKEISGNATRGKKKKRRQKRERDFIDELTAVDVDRATQERRAEKDEVNLHRDLAVELIDIGYRALATRLHPDRGGTQEGMARLNRVRDELKSLATSRRFV